MTRNVRDSTYTADDVSSESSCSDDEPSEECEDDRCRGPTPPIWHCVDCDSSYCRYANSVQWAQATLLTLSEVIVGRCKDPTNPKRKVEMEYLTRRRVHMWSSASKVS